MRFAEERRVFPLVLFLIVVGTTIWVGFDASKRDWTNDRFASKTAYWVLGSLLLWIIIFPVYLSHRAHVPLKNPPSNTVASVGTGEPRTLVASPSTAPSLVSVSRACPHCTKAMPRGASICPHCQGESRAWVYSNGIWWFENEGAWLWLDESSRTWIKAEGA
jgi:hypothetical protein